MAISRFSNSSIANGFPKYQKFWDQLTYNKVPSDGLIAKYETPPSSGSTWTDTVGGYNLSLSGTTYSSSNGGVLTMGNGTANPFPDFAVGTDFSIAAWVKPTSLSGNGYGNSYPFVGINDGGNSSTYLATLGASGDIYINGYGVTGSVVTSTGISTNNWYLIVIGQSGGGASTTVYVNGSMKASNITSFDTAKTGTFTIGYVTSLNTNTFAGQIGSAYVWNKKVSQSEVTQLFNYSRERFGV
jgi:hypothetical protein